MYRHKYVAVFMLALLCTGCGGSIKEQLGLEKESPDEFAVMTRAPLEVPPSLTLPPPQPGAPRPQEQTAIKQAETALLGESTQTRSETTSSAEDSLLQKAGAGAADPNIRSTVNQETENLENRNEVAVQKLFNLTTGNKSSSATVVDADKELERIRAQKEAGQPLTGDGSHSIEE